VISVEEDGILHKLEINNPVMADLGKYSCDINGAVTTAKLDIEGMLCRSLNEFVIDNIVQYLQCPSIYID
jgi:hypothetical protein